MDSRKPRHYTQEYFEELLRASGYKITPARLTVLEALARAGRPLSASEIHERVSTPRRHQVQINYVTIYRSLNAFESDALIRRVPLERDPNYYELAGDDEHHFVCTSCGRMSTFQSPIAARLKRDVRTAGAVFVERYSVQVYGLCRRCA